MKNVSLPKRFAIKQSPFPFYYDENYISNGHFMIKKMYVKNCIEFCVDYERAKIELQRIVPQKHDSEWIRTNKIYDANSLGYLRVFYCEKLNKTVCFKDDYITHFGIHFLLGDSENLHNQFSTIDNDFIIMPCRHEDTDLKK